MSMRKMPAVPSRNFAGVLQGECRLKPAQMRCSTLILLAFALALPVSDGARAASAQDVNKAATEAWRPKDGLYGDQRKDLDGRCADDERLSVALNKKRWLAMSGLATSRRSQTPRRIVCGWT